MSTNTTDRYNPSVADLIVWLQRQADQARRTPDAIEGPATAEQLERVIEAISRLSVAAMAHGSFIPMRDWKPKEGEPVLLRLSFMFPNREPRIQYDVGVWRRDSREGGWDKCRSGTITHCAHIATFDT